MAIRKIKSSLLASTPPAAGNYGELQIPDVEINDGKTGKNARKFGAGKFQRDYVYGKSLDKKTCIWPGGDYSWLDDSSGIPWVGVFADDFICIVTKARDVDVTRVHGWSIFQTKEELLCNFRRTVISEIEDIADPSSKLREMLGQCIKQPFGVVSIDGCHENGHEALSGEYEEDKIFKLYIEEFNRQVTESCHECGSCDEEENSDDESADGKNDKRIKLSVRRHVKKMRTDWADSGYDGKNTIKYLHEEMKKDADMTMPIDETVQQETSGKYNEKKAIEFLKENMKTRDDLTWKDTIQIAISAFQHLLKKKFKADDIGGSMLDVDYPHCPDNDFMELSEFEIKSHLEDIAWLSGQQTMQRPKRTRRSLPVLNVFKAAMFRYCSSKRRRVLRRRARRLSKWSAMLKRHLPSKIEGEGDLGVLSSRAFNGWMI